MTKKVCLYELKKYINWYGSKNIAAIAVGAPTYPYGILDDIQGTAEIAKFHNIPLHVDGCLGGFVTLFLDDDDEMRTQQTDF